MDPTDIIEDLVELLDDRTWEMDDRYVGERVQCTGCGATSKDRKEVPHDDGCPIRDVLVRAEAWLGKRTPIDPEPGLVVVDQPYERLVRYGDGKVYVKVYYGHAAEEALTGHGIGGATIWVGSSSNRLFKARVDMTMEAFGQLLNLLDGREPSGTKLNHRTALGDLKDLMKMTR